MNINYDKYIKIREDKSPIFSLDTTFSYDDVKDSDNVALLVTEPYVVLDVDDMDLFNRLCEIIHDKKIKTRIMKSDRGGHFWFKTMEPLVNNIDVNTPITLKTDVKSWGSKNGKPKKSLVTVKRKGIWRKWLQEDENVDEIPFWLTPIKYKKDLLDLKQGDGRDPQLFSYIIPLLKFGFDKDQIQTIFYIINKYIFDEPLMDSEIDKMFEGNDVFEKKDLHFFDKKTFLHHIFVDWLKDAYFFRSYGDQVYLYDKGRYVENKNEVFRKMIEQIPNLTMRQLNEAYDNLGLKITIDNEKIDPLMVNVKNGMYDLKHNQLLDHSPFVFNINQLDCVYNENAYCKDVDDMIDSVTENNSEIRNLIIEMLGYFLIGDCRFQKAFILLGQGSNGKSKFLEMITNWLGYDNCSSLALEDVSEKFRTAEIVGKLANIGDDSGGDLLKNTAIFKKLVTGDSITVERKNQQPFKFNNSSKLIFSANTLPPSSDKSFGFFRRIVIIPFNAVFNKENKNFDPNISVKLCTDEAKSYILNLAIEGASKILKNNKITIPEEVIEVGKTYEVDNNSVLQWIDSDQCEILNRTTQEVYTDYCLYCDRVGTRPVQIRKCNKEIINKFPEYDKVHSFIDKVNVYQWKIKTD